SDGLGTIEISGQHTFKRLAQLAVIVFLGKYRLLFPFFWLEITLFAWRRSGAQTPGRPGGQNLNSRKERAVLKDATIGDKFSQAARIDRAQLRQHLEDGLCFGGEIKPVFRFVIVKPM